VPLSWAPPPDVVPNQLPPGPGMRPPKGEAPSSPSNEWIVLNKPVEVTLKTVPWSESPPFTVVP